MNSVLGKLAIQRVDTFDMPREKAMALNAHCTLGRGIEKAAKGKLADFKSLLDANYKWLDEILDVAKKTFARYVI